MANIDQFAFLDATAQAELVRKRKGKPIELVDSAIARIERLNPTVNAVVTPMFEQAHTLAKGKLPDGPFTGVPFLLKDIFASYAGVRLTEGSAFLSDFVSSFDSELVKRLKRAGLIILGKTNLPEFGLRATTEPRLFGPCRNPWDTSRITGGSSGGSAAAVATGMVPMAHATDAGGSIRIPSSCCGVFGLKPTRGRIPLGPEYGDVIGGVDVTHAITRSVRDSAALMDATSGPMPGDPYWAPPHVRPFLEEVGTDPGRLRIAFTTTAPKGTAPTGVTVHADCVSAVREAVRLCTDLGHELEEAAPTVSDEKITFALATLMGACATWTIDRWSCLLGKQASPDQFEPTTWLLYEMGRQYGAAAYLAAIESIQNIAREVSNFFLSYDVLLTPTVSEPPVPLGTFDYTPDNPWQGQLREGEFVPFTTISNLTGQPAMSVPLFWNADGLPVGTQFIGRFGDEATLFRLAAQLEAARPWATRRPPVSA
jgi:amidase